MNTQQQTTTNNIPSIINNHLQELIDNKELLSYKIKQFKTDKKITKHYFKKGLIIDGQTYMFKGQFIRCIFDVRGKPTFTCKHNYNITNNSCKICEPEKYNRHVISQFKSYQRKLSQRNDMPSLVLLENRLDRLD